MTTPACLRFVDGRADVSPTVAMLDARAEFAKLRRLLAPFLNEDDAAREAREEAERLCELFADTLHAIDGMADEETVESLEQAVKDEREDLEKEEKKAEAAEERCRELEAKVDELVAVLSESPDEIRRSLANALAEVASRDRQIERLGSVAAKANASASVVERAFHAAANKYRRSKLALEALHMAEEAIGRLQPKML